MQKYRFIELQPAFLKCCFVGGVHALLCIGIPATPIQALGQQPAAEANTTQLPAVTVIADALDLPVANGTAAVISRRQIQNQTYTNPARVLQQVPGVYAREEDGFGIFSNISLRGTDSVRSAKATAMEDGILMSPAPYTAPATYHTPRIGRMSGVEVYKGSAQLRYGPQTTGGAINYLSTPFVALREDSPADSEFYLKSTYGSDNTFFDHAWWGHTQKTDAGTVGILLEMFHHQSDGFRDIDKSDTNTGFTLIEPMLRLFWEPDSLLKQRFEFRFGYSNLDSRETHLGLTDDDLHEDPLRRYAATQFDNFTSEQFRYSLRHIMQPSDSVRIETTAYYTWFTRNWYKLQDIRTPGGQVIGLPGALAAPGEPLDILKGNAAGFWRIRANDRDYEMLGIQSQVDWAFKTGLMTHDLTFGVRLHYDEGTRFERDDIAEVDANGQVIDFDTGRQGAAGNRVENTLAWSMFIEDKIRIGKLTLKPGLRWEHMRMRYKDGATTGPDLRRVIASDSGDLDALAPGIGANYELTDRLDLFGSYYRGISNPAPREYLRGDAQMETGDGFELGVRHSGKTLQAHAAGFYTSVENMIANEGLGGIGTIEDSNGGDARLYGLEMAVRWDALGNTRSDWALPVRAAVTYTKSEFVAVSPKADARSIYGSARPGNEVPYVPEWTASVGIGVEHRRFDLHLDATWTSEMYGTANNKTNLRNPAGQPDARYGKTEDAFILDLSAGYMVNANVRLIAGISNLTDEAFITSRLSSGARANQPRSFYGGVQIRF